MKPEYKRVRLDDQTESDLFYVYDANKRALFTSFNNKMSATMKKSDSACIEQALRPIGNKINLFEMCLRYVAINIDLVDSLIGFPSLMGKILFDECVKLNRFDQKIDKFQSRLNLFSQAYPDQVIESLSLTNQTITCLLPVISLSYIIHLDLTDCGLGGLVDINLVECLKQSAHCLETLRLRDNCLTDTYIQKFTLPQRLGYVNFEKLRVLDLSKNTALNVTDQVLVKHFSKYPALCEIYLTRCDLRIQIERLREYRQCKCVNKIKEVENVGWISEYMAKSLIIKSKLSHENSKGPSNDKFFYPEFVNECTRTLDDQIIVLKKDCSVCLIKSLAAPTTQNTTRAPLVSNGLISTEDLLKLYS